MSVAVPAARAELAAALQPLALGIRAACDARPAHASRPAYSVALLASRPGEGTTSLVCHLARLLEASFGLRICLLDADLRSPSIHRLYGVGAEPGLAELAAGTVRLDDALAVADNDGMAILPAGRAAHRAPRLPRRFVPDLAEGLGRKGFDVLLVDCPSVLDNPEIPVLASQADTTYLVVRSERTRVPDAEGAVASLRNAGCTIGGVVLNRVRQHVPAMLASLR